jgi:hypothetical protein
MPSQKKKKARPGYRREADNHHSTKPAIRMNAPSHSSSLRTASTSGRSKLKIRLPPNSKQGYRREADNHSTKPTIRMNVPLATQLAASHRLPSRSNERLPQPQDCKATEERADNHACYKAHNYFSNQWLFATLSLALLLKSRKQTSLLRLIG